MCSHDINNEQKKEFIFSPKEINSKIYSCHQYTTYDGYFVYTDGKAYITSELKRWDITGVPRK